MNATRTRFAAPSSTPASRFVECPSGTRLSRRNLAASFRRRQDHSPKLKRTGECNDTYGRGYFICWFRTAIGGDHPVSVRSARIRPRPRMPADPLRRSRTPLRADNHRSAPVIGATFGQWADSAVVFSSGPMSRLWPRLISRAHGPPIDPRASATAATATSAHIVRDGRPMGAHPAPAQSSLSPAKRL